MDLDTQTVTISALAKDILCFTKQWYENLYLN